MVVGFFVWVPVPVGRYVASLLVFRNTSMGSRPSPLALEAWACCMTLEE